MAEGTSANSFQKGVSNRYDYSKPFAEQLKDYQNGEISPGVTLIIGATLEVFIDSNAIVSAYGKNHSISKVLKEAIRQQHAGAFCCLIGYKEGLRTVAGSEGPNA